jgi:LmbE family N-acetylglucosaminyl deacetylase
VEVVVVTDGNMGTHDHDKDHSELVSARMNEARKAAEHMGAKQIRFWSYPDLELEARKKMLLKHVVKELLKFRPDIVVSFDPWGHYEAYAHPDHRALAWAVSEGVMLATLPKWVERNGLGRRFLSPKPQLWLMCPAEGNAVVDISSIWDERLNLLRVFESQFDNDFQWEKMSEWVRRTFKAVGDSVGVEYAEGFRILEYTGEWNK